MNGKHFIFSFSGVLTESWFHTVPQTYTFSVSLCAHTTPQQETQCSRKSEGLIAHMPGQVMRAKQTPAEDAKAGDATPSAQRPVSAEGYGSEAALELGHRPGKRTWLHGMCVPSLVP